MIRRWPVPPITLTIPRRRASPHCMVVNLVRSGRKQPQLFFASAGGKARHLCSLDEERVTWGRMTSMKKTMAAWMAAGLLWTSAAAAVDGISIEAGGGEPNPRHLQRIAVAASFRT